MKLLICKLVFGTSLTWGQCHNCEQNQGQDRICWGQDRSATEIHWAKFSDGLAFSKTTLSKTGITECLDELYWLLENAPCLSKLVYDNGKSLIENILTIEQDKKKRKQYKRKIKELKKLKDKYFSG